MDDIEYLAERSWVQGAALSAGGFALLQVAGVQNVLVTIAVGGAAGAGGAILHDVVRNVKINFLKIGLEAGGGALGGALGGIAAGTTGGWLGVAIGTGAVAGINYATSSLIG